MKTVEQAHVVFDRSVREALGYIELAKGVRDEQAKKDMIEGALESLRRFSDDDELIDAMYDAMYDEDMVEMKREEPYL